VIARLYCEEGRGNRAIIIVNAVASALMSSLMVEIIPKKYRPFKERYFIQALLRLVITMLS